MPGGTHAFALALGIDPAPDRARFLFELTRIVYEDADGRPPIVGARLQALAGRPADTRDHGAATGSDADLVPVPLTADIWSRAIFHRTVSREELVAAIIADRQASLVCHGLAALDDETLAYFADHIAMLRMLYERASPAFAAFSGSIHIRDGRLAPPGGAGAVPLWELAVSQKTTPPDRFLLQLLELDDGRLAYLYDVIGRLDPPRRAFVLGLWLPEAARGERFKALATTGVDAFSEWHLREAPFVRGAYDLGMTFARVAVHPSGAPRPPAARGLWARVFASPDLPDDPARALQGVDEEPFDAAWLADAIGTGDARRRMERLDALAFGQRVLGAAADAGDERADAFVALRAVSSYRMLVLGLESMGIRSAAVFAAAARHAARIGALDGRRGFLAQAQFQGALALLSRMARVRTLDAARAGQLVASLSAIGITVDGRYAGGIARWLSDDFAGAVPAGASREAAIVAALSGPSSGDAADPPVTWEGARYRLDLGAAERERLGRVRRKQGALSLDDAVAVAAAGARLGSAALTSADLQTLADSLGRIAAASPRRSRQELLDHSPPEVGLPTDVHDVLGKAAAALAKAAEAQDPRGSARLAGTLVDLGDELVARALLSFAYAASLGDPDGTILLAGDVSQRHEFGFGVRDAELRRRTTWAAPRQESGAAAPWHVRGSLLGLDAALAPLALRRIATDRALAPPALPSTERDAFAVAVALMNPFELRDGDRDAIAAAVGRGERRVAALAARPADLDAVADALGIDGARHRAIRWMLAREPQQVLSAFSTTELLVLGGGVPAALGAWGVPSLAASGCLCPRLLTPDEWSILADRPQLGLTAALGADLNLRVAMALASLRLPAPLARVVLSGAMQDFIDEVRPADDGDWLTLARAARTLTRERVEDYLAVATAVGPLVPQ